MIGKRCFGGELEKYRPIPIEDGINHCRRGIFESLGQLTKTGKSWMSAIGAAACMSSTKGR
jgi:hypothetical protein